MIRFSSLASSSVYGNSYLVEGPDGTRVLIDCGARQRRMLADLHSLGVAPSSISAVLLTHEHADHVYWLGLRHPALAGCGARLLAHPLVWETCPVAAGYMACAQLPVSADEYLIPGRLTQIGSLTVEPFSTPHDAIAPLGFVIHSDGASLGFATDLGHLPPETAAKLAGCTHLVLEANHDRELELTSGRPWHLIERVLGPEGHLSNDQAAEALQDLVSGSTRSVVLAHLSLDCNEPAIALAAAEASLPHGRGGWPGRLVAAPPASPSGWIW